MIQYAVFALFGLLAYGRGAVLGAAAAAGMAEQCDANWSNGLAQCFATLLNFSEYQSAPFPSNVFSGKMLYVSFAPAGLGAAFLQQHSCVVSGRGSAGAAVWSAALVPGLEGACSLWALPSVVSYSNTAGVAQLNFTGTPPLVLAAVVNTTYTAPALDLIVVQSNTATAVLTLTHSLASSPCAAGPCGGAGTCVLNASLNSGFSCACPEYYGGEQCELTPCADQPGRPAPNCSAFARCVVDPRQPGGRGCQCHRGYTTNGTMCELATRSVLFAFYGNYSSVYPGHEQEFDGALVLLLANALSIVNTTITTLSVTEAVGNIVVIVSVPQMAAHQLNRDVANNLLELSLPYASTQLLVNPNSFCESTSFYNCTFTPAVSTTVAPQSSSGPSTMRTLLFAAVGIVALLIVVMVLVIIYRRRKQQAAYVRIRMLARSEDDSSSLASWDET